MGPVTLSGDQFILVIILVKLGVMAALASVLVRSRGFTHVLLTPKRTVATQMGLALSLGLPFAIGVSLRVILGYEALDLAFAGAYLAGLVGGMSPGMLVGTMVGLPALLAREWLAMPASVAVGFVAGLMGGGRLVADEVWEISAVPLIDVYRTIRAALRRRFDRRILVVVSCLGLAMAYDLVASIWPQWLYRLRSSNVWVMVAIWAGMLSSVGIAVKVFNTARMQIKFEAQEVLLARARYEALRSQINPHFLFNTLNTISSAVRTNSDTARAMIGKLASILRRALEPAEAFVPLREEIEFIDSYLDIEIARFGPNRLVVMKEIDPDVLDVAVPSMILQPIVENAILHGISPVMRKGEVLIRAWRDGDVARVSIEDNGQGLSEERLAQVLTRGIGVKNVHERLQVAYGADFGLEFDSTPGAGTTVSLSIPDLRNVGHVIST